jgi:hypothetical protein
MYAGSITDNTAGTNGGGISIASTTPQNSDLNFIGPGTKTITFTLSRNIIMASLLLHRAF